jgi:MFS family permease
VNAASAVYRWNILLLLAGSQAIAYIDRVNFAVVGPHLIKVYDYTPTQVGVLLSAFNWAFTFSLLVAGPLTDWIRPRRSYPVGVGFWSLATALCSLTKSFTPLLVFRALVGIGESLMIPSGSRVIRETFDRKNRAFAVGTFFAGNKIGLTLGIPLASVVLVNWGWEWVFYTTGSLGFFWVAWWVAVYRSSPDDEGDRAQLHEAQRRIRWATLLKYPTTWGIMLGQAGYLYIYYVFATWLPGYLVLQRGLSTLTTGAVGMVPFLVGTICVILGGWAGDRLIAAGRRVTLVRKGFAVGGLFGATVFTIAGAYTPDNLLAITFLTLSMASVAAEFRRERRRVLRTTCHRHVDFFIGRLHGSVARGGGRRPHLRLRLVWADCRQSRSGAGNAR